MGPLVSEAPRPQSFSSWHSPNSNGVEVWSQKNPGPGVGEGSRASRDQVRASGLDLLCGYVESPVAKKVSEPFGNLSLSALVRPGVSVRIDGGNTDETLQ